MDVHHVPEISQQLLKTRSQFLHYTFIKLFIIFESLLGKYAWNNTKIQKKADHLSEISEKNLIYYWDERKKLKQVNIPLELHKKLIHVKWNKIL